ncbi:MAG TPA: glycolate oxidase subunit GlcE [Steroidobacteraceae bacterium]
MDIELLKLREQVLAAARGRRPLRVHGSGTKDFYAEAMQGAALDVRSYRGIIDYEPTELVLTARCGTPLSEIDTILAEHDQFLAFEPPAFGADPTLGGIIAAGLSGPRRLQVGAARDFVLGVSLLAADGELLRFGGQVMKNVAGFDVSRLLCGSLGIFGIMADLSLKVLPRPRAEATLRRPASARAAIELFNRWGGRALPISAAAWCEGNIWLRLSGALSAVRAAQASIGGDSVEANTAERWWSELRHLRHPVFANGSLWRISVPQTTPLPPSPVPDLIDWGGAVRWYGGACGELDPRRHATEAGGIATRWRGAAPQGRFHPLTPAVREIHRRLKRSFDPLGIFNPGRLLAEL